MRIGGPYANFAGHDASRGLAKNSFDLEMITDPSLPIDKLEDLTADEWESLREWEQHFASKYLLVGKLVENEWIKVLVSIEWVVFRKREEEKTKIES